VALGTRAVADRCLAESCSTGSCCAQTRYYPVVRRLGLSIPIDEFSLPESIDIACRAESLGYTDAWSTEAAAVGRL
jgi:hypothetical protein